MHVTDRARDCPRNAEEIRAVSATDAAIAYDRRHEPEHEDPCQGEPELQAQTERCGPNRGGVR